MRQGELKSDEEYIKNSSECPRCEGSNLEGSSFDIGSGSCGQNVFCADCDLEWFDEYRLIGYTLITPRGYNAGTKEETRQEEK